MEGDKDRLPRGLPDCRVTNLGRRRTDEETQESVKGLRTSIKAYERAFQTVSLSFPIGQTVRRSAQQPDRMGFEASSLCFFFLHLLLDALLEPRLSASFFANH